MPDKPAKILIVEDSPSMRELLVAVAGQIPGIVIEQAENGIAALKLLKREPGQYGVIFLDLNMPVMDGLKLLGAIRNDWNIAPTCVCVVTTEGSPHTEEQVRSLGATHFLRKPVKRVLVEEVLMEAFGV